MFQVHLRRHEGPKFFDILDNKTQNIRMYSYFSSAIIKHMLAGEIMK